MCNYRKDYFQLLDICILIIIYYIQNLDELNFYALSYSKWLMFKILLSSSLKL